MKWTGDLLIYMYIYTYAYINAVTMDENDAMNLKKNMKGFIWVFGGKKGKGKIL